MAGLWRSIKCGRWTPNPRAILRSLVSLDDTPHNIALGTAIGMFVGLTPTGGIQMALVLLISLFVRFNRAAGLLATYVSNPFTAVPLGYLSYKVGTVFLPGTFTFAEFVEIFHSDWRHIVQRVLHDLGLPYVVGSVAVAVVVGVLTYPAMLWLLRSVRRPLLVAGRVPEPRTASALAD